MSQTSETSKHKDLIQLYEWCSNLGYRLYWYRLNRETVLLNTVADMLASHGRELMKSVDDPNLKEMFP